MGGIFIVIAFGIYFFTQQVGAYSDKARAYEFKYPKEMVLVQGPTNDGRHFSLMIDTVEKITGDIEYVSLSDIEESNANCSGDCPQTASTVSRIKVEGKDALFIVSGEYVAHAYYIPVPTTEEPLAILRLATTEEDALVTLDFIVKSFQRTND